MTRRTIVSILAPLAFACSPAATTPGGTVPQESSAKAEPPDAGERALVLDQGGKGVGATPTTITPALNFARHRYARRIGVAIGVNAYEGGLPKLTAAVSDARHMAELFRDMGFDEVISLEDDKAKRADILDLLERQIPAKAGPRDLVVVYFAGHGFSAGTTGFVLPQDATRKVEASGITVQKLKETALRFKAPHVLYLVDACFSGSMFRRGNADAKTNDLSYWEAAGQGRVIQIATAGAANETVLEFEGWGAMTRAVHEGLRGAADANKDDVITFDELAQYMDPRVVAQTKGAQHPQWGAVDGSGTVLLWDARKIPLDLRTAPVVRPMIVGLEAELGRIHAMLDRKAWRDAERAVRDVMLKRDEAELHFLLVESYLGSDALGNSRLAEAELNAAEVKKKSPEDDKRLFDLRARLERAKRGPI